MLGQLPSPFPGNLREHSAARFGGHADNSELRRRQMIVGRGPATPLGDYSAELPHRVLYTKGGAGQEGGLGPLSSPVIEGPEADTELSYLRQIRDLLYRLPFALSSEWRTKFIMPPRESISFLTSAYWVNVAAGAAVVVASQTVQQNYTGFIQGVGVGCNPFGSLTDIIWQIRVNGSVHPEFSNRVFAVNTMSVPLPFNFEMLQSRTYDLVAINNGVALITCAGILTGWTEAMSDYKMYGSSPATGIA
jgi:hypothetical protein